MAGRSKASELVDTVTVTVAEFKAVGAVVDGLKLQAMAVAPLQANETVSENPEVALTVAVNVAVLPRVTASAEVLREPSKSATANGSVTV